MALALTGASALAEGQEYTAYKMVSPPAIDGKMDDPCWKNIPWAYGFRNLFEQYSYSPKQTAFKFGYDKDFLYLALRCCEPEMAKVKTVSAPSTAGRPSWTTFTSYTPTNTRRTAPGRIPRSGYSNWAPEAYTAPGAERGNPHSPGMENRLPRGRSQLVS